MKRPTVYIYIMGFLFLFTLLVFTNAVITYSLDIYDCSKHCSCELSDMTCDQIPTTIPPGIKHVNVKKIDWPFSPSNFTDVSWQNVQSLSLSNNSPRISTVLNGTFHTLTGLQHLALHLDNLQTMEAEGLSGLTELHDLDLSGCKRLSIYYLLQNLDNKDNIPNLTSLNIDWLNFKERDPMPLLDMNSNFTQAILPRKLQVFSARHDFCGVFDLRAIQSLCNSLISFDVSDSEQRGDGFLWFKPCMSLRYVNLNRVRLKYPPKGFTAYNVNISKPLEFLFMFFLKLEHIEMNEMIKTGSVPYRIYNCSVDPTMTKKVGFNLKSLSSQNNMIEYLDVTIRGLILENLTTLDLRNNKMEYLSPDLLKVFPSLEVFDLSFNKFWKMQTFNSTKFETLFEFLPNITRLYFTNNNLSFLSIRTFQYNAKLVYLDLRQNSLSQLYFTTYSLRTLILFENRIEYLNDSSMTWLNTVKNITRSFELFLDDERFICTCSALNFFEWLLSSQIVNSTHTNFKCQDNGSRKNVSHQTVGDLRKSCKRVPSILKPIITSVGIVVLVMIVALGSYQTIKRVRIRIKNAKTLEDNIALLKEEHIEDRFAAFLSFCSSDESFVMEHVYPALLQEFRNITENQNGKFVAVGDLHFRPGYGLHGEMINLLEHSKVCIAVISEEYIRSAYCERELDMAYTLKKPIIFLLKGTLDEREMTDLVKFIFENNTRVKLYRQNGEVTVQPSWNKVCTAALALNMNDK